MAQYSMPVELLSDRFRLHEPVGKGGSATVMRAVDTDTGRWVAVKFLNNDRLGENVINEMFDREIRSTSQLRHPNIVELLDFGRDNDHIPYLAFEWLPSSLLDELKVRPVRSWERFVDRFALPVLEGLAYAHSRGVAHRDLTPTNVRLDAEGTPKITDFGLAKLDAALSLGTTVRGNRTEPYVPPEGQESTKEFFTRDMYAFGALVLLALTGINPFTTEYADHPYEALDKARQQLNVPKPIREFIERCLNADPDERPLSAGLGLADLRRAVASATGATIPTLYFTVPPTLRAKVRAAVRADSDLDAIARLEEDFEGELGFLPESAQTEGDKVLSVFGSEYQAFCKVDRMEQREDRLAVLGVSAASKWVLERRRRDAYLLVAKMVHAEPQRPADAKRFLLDLVGRVEAHRNELMAKRNRGDQVLEVWQRMLALQQAIQRKQEDPIDFYKWEQHEDEVLFMTNRAVGPELNGQQRLVRTPQGRLIGGEIVDAGAGTVTLALDFGEVQSLPRSGVLRIDIDRQRASLRRQEDALETLRDGQGPTGLMDVLVDPSQARRPHDVGAVEFVNRGLDDAKRDTIRAALGAPNVLAVHGPPGTGKTTFIAELIVQIRRRQPNARVLVSSQTHAALDNVIERLSSTEPSLRLLRLARRGDVKVSTKVRSFLIEEQLAAWKREATERSREFLRKWASQRGLDLKAVEVAQAYEELAALRDSSQHLNRTVEQLERRLLDGTDEPTDEPTKVTDEPTDEPTEVTDEVTTHYETELTQARVQLRTLVESRRQILLWLQRRGVIGVLKELDSESAESLRAMASSRVDRKHTDYEPCIALMKLQAGWLAQFGLGDEFEAAIVARAAVVAATCVGLPGFRGAAEIDFDVCIVDEASKATPTEMLIPMLRARKWIVVGDPYQLPPFIEEGAYDRELLERHELTLEQLRATLLDRLLRSLPPANSKFLSSQHRMVAAIGNLISTCFYNGQLQNMPVEEWPWLTHVFEKPITWFDTSGLPDHGETPNYTSYSNLAEGRVIKGILKRLDSYAQLALRNRKSDGSSVEVMVLAAYSGQRALLETELAAARDSWPALTVTIGTVDSFQGREADVLLYSLTRSNRDGKVGFLREAARLNVALSRGRKQLAIVGDTRFTRRLASEAGALLGVLEYVDTHPHDCAIVPAVPDD